MLLKGVHACVRACSVFLSLLIVSFYNLSPPLPPFLSFLSSYTDYHGKNVPINDLLSLVFDFTSSRLEGVGGVTDAQAEGEGPSPRSGSKEEVEFIRKWLNQWRSEMDTEMSGKLASTCTNG